MKIQPKKEDRPHVVAIEDARLSIDEQIKELERAFLESVLLLKKERNALAPISKLPPELLLDIFKLANHLDLQVVCAKLNQPHDYMRPVTNLKWRSFIKTAHVCHTWREIIHNSPTFWSRIIFSSEKVAKEMVSRSKSSLLSVKLHYAFLPSRFFKDILVPLCTAFLDVPRLDVLHLYLPEFRLKQVIGHLSGSLDTPNSLRSLYIALPDTALGWFYPSIPPKLFSISMARLEYLYIRAYDLPWDLLDVAGGIHPGFPKLVSLKIWDVKIQWPKLYRILAGTPKLRRLTLRDATISSSSFPIEVPSHVIQLPNLSLCSFEALPDRCFDFQQHVSYPVMGARVRFLLPFRFDTADNAVSESQAVSDLLDTCLISRNNPLAPHTNLLYSLQDIQAVVTIWDGPFRSNPGLSLPIRSSERSIVISSNSYTHPLHNLQIRGLKNVEFRRYPGEEMLNTHDLSSFFEAHAELTHISLLSPSTVSLFSALSRCRHGHGGDSNQEQPPSPPICTETCIPLPNLHTVTIKRLNTYTDLHEMPEEMEVIRLALLVRSRCALPLKTLRVMEGPGSSFSEPIARKISDVVEDFSQGYSADLP